MLGIIFFSLFRCFANLFFAQWTNCGRFTRSVWSWNISCLNLVFACRSFIVAVAVVGRFSHEFHASVICSWSFDDDFEICLNRIKMYLSPIPHWRNPERAHIDAYTLLSKHYHYNLKLYLTKQCYFHCVEFLFCSSVCWFCVHRMVLERILNVIEADKV